MNDEARLNRALRSDTATGYLPAAARVRIGSICYPGDWKYRIPGIQTRYSHIRFAASPHTMALSLRRGVTACI